MEESDLLELLEALDGLGVSYWLDGGWGVDCLLGEQTRPHGDVDVVLPRPALEGVRALLEARGYAVIRDLLPAALALRDPSGREVDLHPVDPTDDGGGDQVLPGGVSWHYPPPVVGSIRGRRVRCASAESQLLMHLGYEPRPIDVADARALAERFGLDVPPTLRDDPSL